jgi:hypothetical protein
MLMRRVFIFLSLSLILSSCNTKVKNDLTERKLNGKVKSVITTTYPGDEKFGEYVKKESISNQVYQKTERFNEKGFVTYILETGMISMREEYFYDSSGHLKEIISKDKKSIVKCDKNGNVVTIDNFSLGNENLSDGTLTGKVTYKYDEKGNQIEMIVYDREGKLSRKQTRLYDKRGNNVESVLSFESMNNNETTFKMNYDEKGNMIYRESYDYIGQKKSKETYKYDENRNEIEADQELQTESGISYSYKTTTKYVFDQFKNWTKMVRVLDFTNSKNIIILEREIEYYE